MSKNFIAPPLSERLVDENGFITTVWQQYLADLFQSNQQYASQVGIALPFLTTTQRDAANTDDGNVLNQSNIPNGLMFYNTSTGEVNVRRQDAWRKLDTSAV